MSHFDSTKILGDFSVTGLTNLKDLSLDNLNVRNQLISLLADGTAPFSVISSTRVANLNVDRAGYADLITTSQKSDNVNYQLPFVSSINASNQSLFTDSAANITYNPSTDTLTVPNISATNITGVLSGSATSLTNTRTLWGQNFNGTANVLGDLISVGNITMGTNTNKATITYTTNIARTYTIPDAGKNANFVLTEGNQTINGNVLISGNLQVTGTTTTNNVEMVSTSNGIVFEGTVADDFELTLKAGALSADRTVTLKDKSGTILLEEDLEDYTTNMLLSTENDWDLETIFTEKFSNSRNGWVQADNEFYVFGGGHFLGAGPEFNYSNEFSTKAYKYNAVTKQLTELSDFPIMINELRGVYKDGFIYLIGQDVSSISDLDKTYKYEISTDTYTLITNPPVRIRYSSGAVLVGNKIYVFVDSYYTSNSQVTINTTPYIYDISLDSWSVGLPTNIKFDRGFAYYYNGLIYVQRSLKFQAYNPTTDTWITDLTPPTYGLVHTGLMHEYKGRLFIGSGWETAKAKNNPFIQYYDVAEDKWFVATRLEFKNHALGYGSTFLYDNKLYYMGGYSNDAEPNFNNVIRSFDLEKLQFEEIDYQRQNIEKSLFINIEYADLVALRDSSSLKKGAFYRITDYETTTVQPETQSAGHLFDIIVQALDEKTISENAFAINSSRDTAGYFNGMRLEVWRLKYTLENDTSKFSWADPTNGKGVIYRMIDEYENDLPYDFKNIQFKRYKIISFSKNTSLEGKYYGLNNFSGMPLPETAIIDAYDFIWAYTFTTNVSYGTSYIETTTLNKYLGSNMFGSQPYCTKNIFGDAGASLSGMPYGYHLGNNVIYNAVDWISEFGMEFKLASYNTIGNQFHSNTVGAGFNSNTIGNEFICNTIGNNFQNNTIGSNFDNNTIGDYVHYNTFGVIFTFNTVGNGFRNNTIGESFGFNTIGNEFIGNTVGNNVMYIMFSLDGDFSNEIKNIHLKNGLSGASSENLLDLYYDGLYGREYPTTFELIANGNVISSWEATPLTRAGKVKATNTTETWLDTLEIINSATIENEKKLSTNVFNDSPKITFENEVLYQERKRGWEAIGEVPVYLRKDEIGTNRIQGSAIVGDEIFWIGGASVTVVSSKTPPLAGASNKNISYNLRTNTWKENLDLPRRKDSPTLVAVGTDIYILGSYGRTNKFYPYASVFTPDYKYDTITNTYEELNSLQDENYLYVSVQSSGADHLDGKIYISGRYWDVKEKYTGSESVLTAPRLAIYDIATDTWTLGPTPPMSNDGGCSKIVNRKFYVYRNTFHYYDIDTETWSEPLNVSGIESRSHTSMAVRNGLIYVIGGIVSGASPSRTSGKTYVYDPILNEWEEDVDLLLNNDYDIGIGYLMAVVWTDKLVVFGGVGVDQSKYDHTDNIENEFPNWYVFIERFRNEKDLTIILDKAKDYIETELQVLNSDVIDGGLFTDMLTSSIDGGTFVENVEDTLDFGEFEIIVINGGSF